MLNSVIHTAALHFEAEELKYSNLIQRADCSRWEMITGSSIWDGNTHRCSYLGMTLICHMLRLLSFTFELLSTVSVKNIWIIRQ